MKAVFDTSVLLSSTLWDWSVSQKLLHKLILSNASIFSSPEIINEYLDVLHRDFDYTKDEANEITKVMFSFLTIIMPKEKLNIVNADPDDNKIIECAMASGSDYIVTYDSHLLELKEFRGVKIMTPEEMIAIMDST